VPLDEQELVESSNGWQGNLPPDLTDRLEQFQTRRVICHAGLLAPDAQFAQLLLRPAQIRRLGIRFRSASRRRPPQHHVDRSRSEDWTSASGR